MVLSQSQAHSPKRVRSIVRGFKHITGCFVALPSNHRADRSRACSRDRLKTAENSIRPVPKVFHPISLRDVMENRLAVEWVQRS